jgi:serine/threonine protein kinase
MAEESTKKPNRRAERIGKYEILEHIASGGMGIVYLARDPDLDRKVALKILAPELATQTTTLIRFKREAQAAAKLRHENIVSIYEIGEFNGAHYIALEYVDGTDLQAYIGRKCRLDPNEARLLMIQATRALVHAHEHGIVHRDIKPSNFLLTFKDKKIVLKLTDFGLAIQHENDAEFRLTKDKTTVGTVDYMSPEQARDSRSADIRSDIYSLGCTFYHMLGGSAPFARGTLPERIVQHMRSPAPDVRKLNQSVPEPLVAIIQRMLAKKPDDRYQTPADVLYDLEHLDEVPVPRKNDDSGKRGHVVNRMSKAEVTTVIEKKELDAASAAPVQVKTPKPRKKVEVPDDAGEPDEDAPETELDAREAPDDEPKRARKRSKDPIQVVAASSPVWMYAAAGIVAVLGLILVLVFSMDSQPLPKKEPDKKAEVPAPLTPVVVNTEKKVAPPQPPPPIVNVDPTPQNQTVVMPPLPIMDLDPAKADIAALYKDHTGEFTTFPSIPEKAHVVPLRRLSVAGSPAANTLADALAQTKAEQFSIIEIHDHGPIFVGALPSLAKRTVVLRGAAGYRPLVVWELPKKSADLKSALTFFTLSRGQLILDNVDFVMKAPLESSCTIFDLPGSDFFARDCTFSVAGNSAQGIALLRRSDRGIPRAEQRKTQTWLKRCYLRGPAAQLLHHDETSAEVLLEESLLVGQQHPLLSTRARDEDFLALHCVRSTLVTGQILARWQSSSDQRLNPHFQGRLLDSILSRDDPTAPQGDLLQVIGDGDTNRMHWKATNCVYAGWKQLLASSTKNISGDDLKGWQRHFAYNLSDRVVVEAWPISPPSNLEEQSADTFLTTASPFAYTALTGSGALGCVIGRLPPAPAHWQARTIEPALTPVLAAADSERPPIDSTADGMYHGERLDLNKVDLGAHLASVLQKMPPGPRVVMHLTGRGVCHSSPLRVQGVQHLILYVEPSANNPLILEVNPTSGARNSPLFEMSGGHLEMIGMRVRLNPLTFVPTIVHVQGGHLTLSRCWLNGPWAKSADHFKALVTIANPTPNPTSLLLRDNVLVSSKLLIHAQENVHIKARNNVLASFGNGVLLDIAAPIESRQHLFDHNTWAVRQAFLHLRAAPESELSGTIALHMSNNAFLRPFEPDPIDATLTRGFEAWSARGRLIWQGRNNVYDARLPAYHKPGQGKAESVKQTLSDWQRVWGQAGEHEARELEAAMAPRTLTFDGLPINVQLERLVLPRQIRVDAAQGFPGADLFALGILRKK